MSKSSIPTRSCGGANGNLLTLPVVGVGSWSFGSDDGEYWGKREQTTTNEIVAAALAHGGQAFFDTAEAYQSGRSESALGEALKAAVLWIHTIPQELSFGRRLRLSEAYLKLIHNAQYPV